MNEIAQLYIFSCFLIIQQRYWYRPLNPGHSTTSPEPGTVTSIVRHMMSLVSQTENNVTINDNFLARFFFENHEFWVHDRSCFSDLSTWGP